MLDEYQEGNGVFDAVFKKWKRSSREDKTLPEDVSESKLNKEGQIVTPKQSTFPRHYKNYQFQHPIYRKRIQSSGPRKKQSVVKLIAKMSAIEQRDLILQSPYVVVVSPP
jgi:hypothetical protein